MSVVFRNATLVVLGHGTTLNDNSATPVLQHAAELRRRGILYQSLPWGVADPKVYWQLLDLGVMSFATDHPEVTLKAVRDYCEGSLRPMRR